MANRSERLKRIHARLVVEQATHLVKTPCWLWQGAIGAGGYGLVQTGRRSPAGNRMPSYVHRVMYEDTIGPVPEGKVLDHLCRVRHCCNPEHLESVSERTNIVRGEGISADYAVRDECGRGHPKTPENRYMRPDGKGWCCLPCMRLRGRKHYRKANDARKAAIG